MGSCCCGVRAVGGLLQGPVQGPSLGQFGAAVWARWALTASPALVPPQTQVLRGHPLQEGGLHETLEGSLVRAGQDQAPGERGQWARGGQGWGTLP